MTDVERFRRGLDLLQTEQLQDAIDALGGLSEASSYYWPARALLCVAHLHHGDAGDAVMIGREVRSRSSPEQTGYDLWVQVAYHLGDGLAKLQPAAADVAYRSGLEDADRFVGLALPAEHVERVRIHRAHLLATWGGTLLLLGRRFDAEHKLYQALSVYDELGVSEGPVEAHLTLAQAAMLPTRYEGVDLRGAVQHLDDAEALASRLGNTVRRGKLFDRILVERHRHAATPGAATAIAEAAQRALDEEQPGVAQIRLAAAAEVARRAQDYTRARDYVGLALDLEDELGLWSSHRIRYTKAHVARDAGDAPSSYVGTLFDAASIVYERLAEEVGTPGLQVTAQDAHELFRLLARALLLLGRPPEALAAFEYGRVIEYGIRSGYGGHRDVLRQNPFASGSQVDTRGLERAAETLRGNEVALVTAVLPSVFVAFCLAPDGTVTIGEVALDATRVPELERELADLPENLADPEVNSYAALPSEVWDWESVCSQLVRGRAVRRIAPYGLLHSVPWGALLHETCGRWTRVPLETVYSLLLSAPGVRLADGAQVISMGHGIATSSSGGDPVDLHEEAVVFARAFGTRGRVVDATAENVASALALGPGPGGVVHVSCHGDVDPDDPTGQRSLRLSLEDGEVALADLLSDHLAGLCIVLSACESGVYEMGPGDTPVGIAPELIARGARAVLATRSPVDAAFMLDLMERLAPRLAEGDALGSALAESLEDLPSLDRWSEAAGLVLLVGPVRATTV